MLKSWYWETLCSHLKIVEIKTESRNVCLLQGLFPDKVPQQFYGEQYNFLLRTPETLGQSVAQALVVGLLDVHQQLHHIPGASVDVVII